MRSLCWYKQAGAFPFYTAINICIQNTTPKRLLLHRLPHYRFPIQRWYSVFHRYWGTDCVNWRKNFPLLLISLQWNAIKRWCGSRLIIASRHCLHTGSFLILERIRFPRRSRKSKRCRCFRLRGVLPYLVRAVCSWIGNFMIRCGFMRKRRFHGFGRTA